MKRIIRIILALVIGFGIVNVFKPLPEGLNFKGEEQEVENVRFLADRTFVNARGEREIQQEIFDEVLNMIRQARSIIVVDMFLFNDYLGALEEEPYRALSSELTAALVAQKQRYPNLHISVISDPINTVYGGARSEHFDQLREAGIQVTVTDLTRLRSSNPIYTTFWAPFVSPFGNKEANTVPNPFGEGGVSIRSYLALLNFKANHRKVVLSDHEDTLVALVTSANPHDGSSAHGNVALQFSGAAAHDLLQSEMAVLDMSNAFIPMLHLPVPERPESSTSNSDTTVQVLTEGAVERALLEIIGNAERDEWLDLAVFYMSDRHVIEALIEASQRGVNIRVLLDPNKDAFGREKNGIPNRPVAHELVSEGIAVRWCNTQGEQCHSKWLMHRTREGHATMVLGSTNFTRRNMHNLNLETSVVLRGDSEQPALDSAHQWFEQRWFNLDGHQYSIEYAVYADDSKLNQLLYRVMEATGLSTF
ncbi:MULTISPECIES: phospholipase D-like domain-containing protein [Gammaproteobacteria]|uniref:phospholipase D-like domain-containing protein n=1 Tax=Gammaproteobacteria TaxID=1236 RepID=UPI000DD097F8|nr:MULTISPECIES: phospholipase D-like domain-containing protein [Gammaproteobacteria]RTE87070.1 phospholipase [Aliidiomarina sp. B3213]TCZ93140.1 phospholipase [Lysobacter sp. N42]